MITIAIPTYNGAHLIENAIKSIYMQKAEVSEVLIVDDHSSDNTIQVVSQLKDKYNQLDIEIFSNNKNVGYQANWNKCFDYCKTKYLIILHQDDMLIDNSIKTQINVFEKNTELAIVGGNEDSIDESGQIIKKRSLKGNKFYKMGEVYEFISSNGTYIPCSSVMFNMDKIRKVGYFETDVLGTDELYWSKVLTMYPIAIQGKSLIYRRYHTKQTEWSDFVNKKHEVYNAYQRFLKLKDYEKRKEKKIKIDQLINQKFYNSLIGIGGAVIRHNRSTKLAYWYLGKAIAIGRFNTLKKYDFWKVLILGLINTIGVYDNLKNYKHYFIK